jgi:hypothetical protein
MILFQFGNLKRTTRNLPDQYMLLVHNSVPFNPFNMGQKDYPIGAFVQGIQSLTVNGTYPTTSTICVSSSSMHGPYLSWESKR